MPTVLSRACARWPRFFVVAAAGIAAFSIPAHAENWVSIGPTGAGANGNGRARGMLLRPRSVGYEVYLGASSGGIWWRDSVVDNWTPVGDKLPNLRVGGLWVDPTDSNVPAAKMAVGTGTDTIGHGLGNGSGFYYTTDGGLNWREAARINGASSPRQVFKIIYDAGNPNTLVAATDTGMYLSTDGGQGWRRQQAGIFHDVAVDGGNAATLYACRVDWPSGIYRSPDFGWTWPDRFSNADDADIPPGAEFQVTAIGTCKGVAGAVALLVGYKAPGAPDWTIRTVLRSVDAGASWTNITGDIPVGQSEIYHARAITFRPNNVNEIYVGSVELYRTTNAGDADATRWTSIDHGHDDVNQLSFYATSGDNVLWICNDGGLYRYNVGGTTENWNGNTAFGLRASEMYCLDAKENPATGSLTVVAGLQDNSIVRTTDGGSTWTYHSSGDGIDGQIVDDRTGECYVSISSGYGGGAMVDRLFPDGHTERVNVSGSADVGYLWFDCLRNPSRIYAQQYLQPPGDPPPPDHKYILSQALPATPDNWTTEFEVPTTMHRMMGSPLDGTIYVSFWAPNNTLVVARRNTPWDITTRVYTNPDGIPLDGSPATVHCSISRPGRVWVGCERPPWDPPGQHMILYHDGYTDTWEDRTGNLIGLLHGVSVVAMPFQEDELYAATDIGVYHTTDGGQTWAPFADGMPTLSVSGMKLIKRTTGTDTLVVSTFGRGVWKRDVPGIPIVYVDARNSGTENGTFDHPFNTFAEGQAAVPSGGILALHGDTYMNAPITLSNPMTIQAYELPASIR